MTKIHQNCPKMFKTGYPKILKIVSNMPKIFINDHKLAPKMFKLGSNLQTPKNFWVKNG